MSWARKLCERATDRVFVDGIHTPRGNASHGTLHTIVFVIFFDILRFTNISEEVKCVSCHYSLYTMLCTVNSVGAEMIADSDHPLIWAEDYYLPRQL